MQRDHIRLKMLPVDEYYFIEDETVAPLQNIPVSVRYLKSLKF